MDFATSTVSGIIGGVIATVIWSVLRQFYLKVVDPWHEEKVYKDARIEGRWKSRYTLDGVTREGIWEIRRVGHSVRARVTRTKGPQAGSTWNYAGTFRNLILTATYSPTNRRMLDRGAITLMLRNNGETLQGWLTFYSNSDHQVRSVEYECTRVHEENLATTDAAGEGKAAHTPAETTSASPKEPPVQ